jgi:hypothetical protein
MGGRYGNNICRMAKPTAYDLALIPDRSAIVATAHQQNPKSDKMKPPHFQIWSYVALGRNKQFLY